MTPEVPTGPHELTARITAHIDAGRIREALACCRELNRSHPDDAYGWYLASFLMRRVRHYGDALKAIERALALARTDRYQLHKARCLLESGDRAGASAAAAAIGDGGSDPLLQGEAGTLLHLLGDHPAALRRFTRAIELDGRNPQFHYNRAAVLRYLGDVEGAEAGFDAVIALRPEEHEAYNGRAQLRTWTRERNHITELQAVLARTSAIPAQVQLLFALAKEQEDVGDHDEAFASLKAGCDLKRSRMQYRVDTDLQMIAKIREVYGRERFAAGTPGCPSAEPIFVIGMPRTGTTLVERILSSHSAVCSAGELNTFSLELLRLAGAGEEPGSRLDLVTRTAQLDFAALGAAYVRGARTLCDASPHFIDKLPFNFLYAGLIHLALPRAKIVHLQRHPMDTCYAIYKQLFKEAYPYSYDLQELARYYAAYRGLMQHWDAVLPGVIHTVGYEDLVADTEGEARRLLAHCGLAWEAQCLRFYEKAEPSTTASALQVRQPVYRSSVGKWRHYARQLEPLREQLESAGIDTR